MSTRDRLYEEIAAMSEAQCSAVLALIHAFSENPNAETLAAMHEAEDMKQHPEQYPGYTDVHQMMEELLK